MIILAIETSCDDTGIALIKASGKKLAKFDILSNIVSSQIKVHQKFGGVVPNLAAREHLKNLPICLKKALKEAKNPKIDLIAATIGPGLIPSLLMGANFARALAYTWNKPILGVNHIDGHIYSNFIQGIQNPFPSLCLLVSGGHTQLTLMKNHGKFKLLGETRDDAAGECFDKIAKLLRLGYPGGPIISKMAEKGNPKSFNLPRPMIKTKDYDFSFSGLKTAVLYLVKDLKKRKTKFTNSLIFDLCASSQQAIVDVLVAKATRAAKEHRVKTVMLSGGVAANDELRKQLSVKCQLSNVNFLVPSKKFCTDNALMIAVAGYFKYNFGKPSTDWRKIKANANLRLENW